MNDKKLSYLALGDSYTIGEGVPQNETYPAQLVELLKEQKLDFESPEIIAVTGWTTDELQEGIRAANIEGNTYDLVTLLIGVNNQYRQRSVENYQKEFAGLLQQAIEFANRNKTRVKVLSIPDWGITEFASQQKVDKNKVAKEIDAFNDAQRQLCQSEGVFFLDITQDYRSRGYLPENLVADGLHPSGRIYRTWAEMLASLLEQQVTF
ncbi:SGNH/GDSL hydrolase family protein [Echinicola sediminis]